MNEWLFTGLGCLLMVAIAIYTCREWRKDMKKKMKEFDK